MSTRPLQPSKYLSPNQKRTVARIMEIMIPGSEDDPGAEQVGSVEFVDLFLDELSEQDRKDLLMLVKVLSRPFGIPYVKLPERIQKGLLNVLKNGRFPVKTVSAQMRLGFFALLAMTMTAFYSNFTAPGYSGPAPWEMIGFEVPEEMIPEGALETPELAHLKRQKEAARQEAEAR